ncbi:MAG TPA: DUF924 family protein [Myxococcota bacterium]|nr:DUF924 family protein [Myxococcota bacterium]
MLTDPTPVVEFWKSASPARWYAKNDDFDTEFRRRFEGEHMAAARREREDWMGSAPGALGLMILLDQFPRNCYRGTAHQFATDPLARLYCRQAIERGYLFALKADLRQFLLLPLMHSEAIADQDALLPLVSDMPETLKFAHIHRDIILRFDRFPHRNEALGRETSAREAAFLKSGGFGG